MASSLTYRFPAEWERHEATWIGWPHNTSDWPGKFEPIPWVFAEMARTIALGEIVRLIVQSAAHERSAKRQLKLAAAPLDRIEFHRHPTDRGWTRDFGPMFVRAGKKSSSPSVVKFRFNAWAKYPDWRKDNAAANRIAKRMGFDLVQAIHKGRDVVLEGGAIDVNGRGTLITTEECLLDKRKQVRNPGLSRKDMNQVFNQYLGATNVLWLGRGIAGDDTHGHVDDLCRFVNPRTVVLCQERNRKDANYRALQENRERFQGMKLENGSRINVVALPMPSPVIFERRRLPASYANFYIANSAVLVPTFNDPNDRIALGILSDLFKDRPVVGIHAVDLVWGLGTIHCLTQQQPA